MSAINRIRKYIENKGFTNSSFEKKIGLSNGYIGTQLRRNANLGEDIMNKILDNCLDINPTWLLTGKGNMIISDQEESAIVSEPAPEYNIFGNADKVYESQNVPLYDLAASAGIVSLFNDSHTNPIDYIHIPGAPKCDGSIYITGDSMYPLLKSGDIVMYKKISDPINTIYFYGEIYILGIEQDGDHFVVVKYIHRSDKGDDFVKLVSQNKHHDDIDIPKISIRALAMVNISIRMNRMK